MIKYKIIDLYCGEQITEFFHLNEAEEYLKNNQRIGKVGQLKGKPVLRLRTVNTEKQRKYNLNSRNKSEMKMEMFGI